MATIWGSIISALVEVVAGVGLFAGATLLAALVGTVTKNAYRDIHRRIKD